MEKIVASTKQSWPGLEIRNCAEGRGVFAIKEFKKNSPVCNYGGVFLQEEYVKDNLIEDDEKNSYLLELRENYYDVWATLYLNHDKSTHTFGKYINHSKLHPNLTYKIYITKDDKPDVIFFANAKIDRGSELLWNYGNNFSGVKDCVKSCQKCKSNGKSRDTTKKNPAYINETTS